VKRKQKSRTICFHPDRAADRAQDRTIVTTGTGRSRGDADKTHRRNTHAPALAVATGCSQTRQRGPTSVASKGRELSRSGLVRLWVTSKCVPAAIAQSSAPVGYRGHVVAAKYRAVVIPVRAQFE
jgi:hypothetical protein